MPPHAKEKDAPGNAKKKKKKKSAYMKLAEPRLGTACETAYAAAAADDDDDDARQASMKTKTRIADDDYASEAKASSLMNLMTN